MTVASSVPGDTKAANSLATPAPDIRRNSDGGAALVASGEKTSLPPSASLDQQGLGASHQATGSLLVDNRHQTPSSAPCEPSSSDPASSPWRSWTRHSISASCPEQTLSGQPLQPGYTRKASCTSQNSRQETKLEVEAVDEAATQQRSRYRGSSLRSQRFLGYDGRQRADSASDSEEGPTENVVRGRVGGGQTRRHSFRVPRPSNGHEATQPQQTWTSSRPPQPPLPPCHQGWGGEGLHVSSDRLISIR